MHRVLVIGGYGFFGSKICAALARNRAIHLIVAGRDANKATELAYQVGIGGDRARKIDAEDPQLAGVLRKLGVNTLIHTAGPFQGQDYAVARAAIQARCNYFDLADGRAFVRGITSLDGAARAADVAVVSGVSTLPALSSAVIDRQLPDFARLDTIRIGLSSGGVIPGIATVRGVLGYAGKPFKTLDRGRVVDVHGWLDRIVYDFPKPVGPRLLGRCDVPDLDLLPKRYPSVQTISFHAGFASEAGHKCVELLARQVRDGRLRSALPFAKPLNLAGKWLRPLFSDRGGMFVRMEGLHENGAPLRLAWHLVARENHGPHIPCAAAIALTNKVAAGAKLPAGATPCMGLLDVDDVLEPLKGLSIRELPAPAVHEIR